MPASRASFNSLPSEVHSLIIIQASLQDAVYRKERLRERASQNPFSFIRSQNLKHYGTSTMALYSTCKHLRTLASPYVFKILPLSKTVSGFFHVQIKRKYASSFTTLVIDCAYDATELSSEEEVDSSDANQDKHWGRQEAAVKDLFLGIFPLLPNIHTVEFMDDTSTDFFSELVPVLSESEWSDSDKADVAIAKQAARLLSDSVKTIQIGQFIKPDDTLLNRFENVTTLTLDARHPDKLGNIEVRTALSLTSLSVHLDTGFEDQNRTLPTSWTANPGIIELKSLELDFPILHDSEARFIHKFSASLTSLTVSFHKWKLESSHNPKSFPSLRSLSVRSGESNITRFLNQVLSLAKLTELKIVISSLGEEKDHKDLLRILKSLGSSRLTFSLQLPANVAESVWQMFGKRDYFGGGTTLSSTASWNGWSKDPRDLDGNEGFSRSPVKASELTAFLAIVAEDIEQAERVGDSSGVEEWACWMRPLVGRKNLTLQ